jgi:hypothetical protein
VTEQNDVTKLYEEFEEAFVDVLTAKSEGVSFSRRMKLRLARSRLRAHKDFTQREYDAAVLRAEDFRLEGPACAAVKREERGGLGQRTMAINYRSHFAYRIDAWDADGENVIEHLAGVEDLQVAKATYLAACQRWPGTPITLRQGTRVIEDSRQTRLV